MELVYKNTSCILAPWLYQKYSILSHFCLLFRLKILSVDGRMEVSAIIHTLFRLPNQLTNLRHCLLLLLLPNQPFILTAWPFSAGDPWPIFLPRPRSGASLALTAAKLTTVKPLDCEKKNTHTHTRVRFFVFAASPVLA